MYVLQMMDANVTYTLLIVGFFKAIGVAWVYGELKEITWKSKRMLAESACRGNGLMTSDSVENCSFIYMYFPPIYASKIII